MARGELKQRAACGTTGGFQTPTFTVGTLVPQGTTGKGRESGGRDFSSFFGLGWPERGRENAGFNTFGREKGGEKQKTWKFFPSLDFQRDLITKDGNTYSEMRPQATYLCRICLLPASNSSCLGRQAEVSTWFFLHLFACLE